jgi:hypothetical protein
MKMKMGSKLKLARGRIKANKRGKKQSKTKVFCLLT